MPIFPVNFLTFVFISHLAQHPDFWYPDFTDPRYRDQNFRQMSLDKIPAGSLSPTKPDWKLLRHGNTHCSSATIYINSNTHLLSISWQILYWCIGVYTQWALLAQVYTFAGSVTLEPEALLVAFVPCLWLSSLCSPPCLLNSVFSGSLLWVDFLLFS